MLLCACFRLAAHPYILLDEEGTREERHGCMKVNLGSRN